MKNIFRKSALIVLAAAAMTGCIKVIEPQEGSADVNQVGSAPNAIQNYVDAVTRSICGKLYFGSSYAHDLGLPGMMLARDVTGQDIVFENSGTEWFSTWYQVGTGLGPQYLVCQLPWTCYYALIDNCNRVLQITGEDPTDADLRSGAGIA